jgi:hypothetical protein
MTASRAISLSFCLAASVAASPVFAKDPCASLICMAGQVQGSGGQGCDGAISDFLSIVQYHHGHIDYNATPNARRDYLNSCPGASENTSNVDSIISAFGGATHL